MTRPHKEYALVTRERAVYLYKKGYSLERVAKVLDIALLSSIIRWLKVAGVERRRKHHRHQRKFRLLWKIRYAIKGGIKCFNSY